MMETMRDSEPPKRDWEYYRSLPDDERWELIDGQLYAMSAPLTIHQRISRDLSAHSWLHFRGRPCEVFTAPVDVKLSEYDNVQPDILVVCKPGQVLPTHVEGPPALVIEILSPSSVRHDRIRKFNLYARFGVKEYWLVHPASALVEVFYLDGLYYVARGAYSECDVLESPTFPELRLELSAIFPVQAPDEVRERDAALYC